MMNPLLPQELDILGALAKLGIQTLCIFIIVVSSEAFDTRIATKLGTNLALACLFRTCLVMDSI